MEFTGERVILGKSPTDTEKQHIHRYYFASQFVRGKTCLDIACGIGYGSRILCDAGAEKVVGVDISEKAIDYAIKHYGTEGIDFVVSNAEYYNYGTYDLIVSFETIEHLNNRNVFLSNLHDMLELDGKLIISTPNKAITSPLKRSDQPVNKWHRYEYTQKQFIIELNNAGFEILMTCGQKLFPKLFNVEIITRFIKKIYSELSLFEYLFRENPEVLPLLTSTAEILIIVCKKK